MKIVCLLGAILFTLNIFCQNETSKWYFGEYAGLDFMTAPPTILTNGALNTLEGCATIADAAGNLIMYTDGVTIWNSSHTVIPNGTGLSGNVSTTQSAIIVKQPGNSIIFFVFTLGAGGGSPLNFSTVDMSLAVGAGSVIVKNTLLNSSCTEKLTAVNHCNGKDVWVLIHRYNSADYYAYLITSVGVNTTAIVSTIGSAGFVSNAGYLKISPNGKKAVSAMTGLMPNGAFELYDFDNITGVFSNSINLQVGQLPYGCEFSPDGTKLYGTELDGTVFQWNLCAGSPTAVAASLYTVANASPQRGALQLGKDGKIYAARYSQQVIGVINNPNALGSSCNYVDFGQSVSTQTCVLGLPNFNASYFRFPLPTFTATINPTLNCQSVSFNSAQLPQVCSAVGSSITGISWFFGDPASGTNSTSTLTNPVHVFSGPGTYTVKQTFNTGCATDTLKQVITINGPGPNLTITPDFTICTGQQATLTANGADTYSWNTGPTTTTIPVSPTITTSYTITGTNTVSSCAERKVITVTVSKCLGVEKYFSDNSLSIYPNPTKGEFTVRTDNGIHLEVFNQLGEKIAEYQLETGMHILELKGVTGIYFIKAVSNRGVFNCKLVKSE